MEQFLRVNITGDSSKLQKSLKGASASLKTFGSKLTSIGQNLSLRVTAPLALAGGASIKMASDFQESLNKVDVAFKDSSKEVKDFAKTTLKEFGIARGTALDMAALFGDMSTSMGLTTSEASKMSRSLVGLAGDLASFKNMNIEEVTTALAGVFTGETESLKRLGIVMTQVNLENFALQQGIKKSIKEMTQAEKVTLRYQFIMSKTANAQGDFARTSEGAANQMRIFQESTKELGASFGQVILPAFTKVVKSANLIMSAFKDLDADTKKLIVTLSGLTAAIPLLVYALGTLSTALAAINPVTIAVTASLAALGGVIAKTSKLKSVTTRINEAKGKIKELGAEIKQIEKSKPFLQGNIDSLKEYHEKQKELNKSVIDFYQAQIEGSPNAKKATEQFGGKIEEAKNKIVIAESALKSLNTQITNMARTSGDLNLDDFVFTTPELVEDESKLASSLDSLFNTKEVLSDLNTEMKKFDPSSVNVADIFAMDDEDDALSFFDGVKTKLKETKKQFNEISSQIHDQISPAFNELGSAIKSNLNLGDNALGRFAGMMIDMAMSVISTALAASTAAAIQGAAQGSLLAGPAAPFVIGGLIAAAVGTVASAFSSVPALANGGIVSAPTLAMVGDNLGANRGNPEVISPLNKLKGMMASSDRNINVGGKFRLEGQDLVVALQRADRNRSRLI